MMHTDMAIIDSMVAARQEQVATSIWESHQRISLLVALGSLLVRVGQWLKEEPAVTANVRPMAPTSKRPRLA